MHVEDSNHYTSTPEIDLVTDKSKSNIKTSLCWSKSRAGFEPITYALQGELSNHYTIAPLHESRIQ